jgi:F-type H+-transporting ATPase subunit a
MEQLAPRAITVFGLAISDTVISTWILMGLIVAFVLIVRRRAPILLEMLIEFISDGVSDFLGAPVGPYLPFLGALMIFLIFANTLGAAPFITTPTRDLNVPLALAIVVFFAVHYFGARAKGLGGYLKEFATPMLPLDIIGQVSRTASLALRLFGNVVSTEMIVAVIANLVPVIAPLPMIGLSMFTGLLQAYIFTTLAAVYIGTALEE